MAASIRQIMPRYIIESFGRQIQLMRLVHRLDWHADLAKGLIGYGDVHLFRIQLLATISEADQIWIWAWTNTDSNIPAHLLVASLALKAFGEQHGISELTTPQLPLDQIDGHTLALLASGICEANAYYRCPYDGGAAFVLIKGENFPHCTEPPLARLATVFPQAISAIEIPDHRLAFISYLEYYGLAFEEDATQVVVKEGDKPVMTASFDELKRLTKLEATIKPRPEA